MPFSNRRRTESHTEINSSHSVWSIKYGIPWCADFSLHTNSTRIATATIWSDVPAFKTIYQTPCRYWHKWYHQDLTTTRMQGAVNPLLRAALLHTQFLTWHWNVYLSVIALSLASAGNYGPQPPGVYMADLSIYSLWGVNLIGWWWCRRYWLCDILLLASICGTWRRCMCVINYTHRPLLM